MAKRSVISREMEGEYKPVICTFSVTHALLLYKQRRKRDKGTVMHRDRGLVPIIKHVASISGVWREEWR